MKFSALLLAACAIVSLFAACCTSTGPGQVTPVPTTGIVTPVPTAVSDQELLGTWYVAAMTGPGGSNPIQVISVQMDAVFSQDGGLAGYSGCNHFSGTYSLTGKILPDGKGIAIGPLTSTLMYCAGTSDLETRYLEVLKDASSYSITGNQLIVTSRLGSTLVFHRTPPGPTAVPRGI